MRKNSIKYVAVEIKGVISIHMPHDSGNYATLCGLDGDDPYPEVDQKVVPLPEDAKIDCLECFQLWNVSRKFGIDDFVAKRP